jgi:hypothetical protein
MKLVKGEMYIIKPSVKVKATDNPVKYCGTENYDGKTYHNFFDAEWKLFHWINPDEVQPVNA